MQGAPSLRQCLPHSGSLFPIWRAQVFAEMLCLGPYYLPTVDPPPLPRFYEAPHTWGKFSSPGFSAPLLFLPYLFTFPCIPCGITPVLCDLQVCSWDDWGGREASSQLTLLLGTRTVRLWHWGGGIGPNPVESWGLARARWDLLSSNCVGR